MFDIKTAADFYAAMVQDFDDFMNEPSSTRRALHCAITSYHLREWIWHDLIENDANFQFRLGVSDEASFNAWVNQTCVWFAAVRGLVNGTKHFESREGFETMRVKAPPLMFDVLGAGLDQGALDGPVLYEEGATSVNQDRGYLLIDFGEGAAEHRWLPAAHLLEVVVRFWHDFFRIYVPALDVPKSKNHLNF